MAENIPTVQEAFAGLEKRGIAICFPDRITRWCFKHYMWIILTPLVLLILTSVFSPEDPILDFRALGELQDAQAAYEFARHDCQEFNEHNPSDHCSEISEVGLFAHTLRVLFFDGSRIRSFDDDSWKPSAYWGWYYDQAEGSVDATWYTSAVLFVLGIVWLFRNILKRIIDKFADLATTGRLLPDPEHADSPWRDFTAQLERSIHSRWRWAFIAAGFVLVGFYVFTRKPSLKEEPLLALQNFIKIIFTPALCAFMASVMVWILWVFGTAIRELTPAFKLDILPEHPDDSGGLARIGEMALLMVLPFTLGVIFLSIWISIDYPTKLLLPGVVLLILIGGLVFFWSLWDVHQVMLTDKVQYQDDLAEQIRETEDKLLKILDRTGSEDDYDEGATKRLQDLLDTLRSRKDVARTYPAWPFSRKLVVRIFSQNTVPPLIGLLLNLTLAGSWAEFVAALTKK